LFADECAKKYGLLVLTEPTPIADVCHESASMQLVLTEPTPIADVTHERATAQLAAQKFIRSAAPIDDNPFQARADGHLVVPRVAALSKALAPRFRVLEEIIDGSQEPDETSVLAYAEWLGIDTDTDADLLWIARAGLTVQLPFPWKPCEAVDDGELFYFNFDTGESVWDHPCDEYHRQLFADECANKYGLLVFTDPTPIAGVTHGSVNQ